MSPDDTATTRRALLSAAGATVIAGCSGRLSSVSGTTGGTATSDTTTATRSTTITTAAPDGGSTDWAQVGRSAAHNGRVPEFTAETEPDVAWETAVDGSLTTPTVVGDVVYVTRGVPGGDGPDATLEAYGLETGERRWGLSLGAEFQYNAPLSNHRPVVYGETIYATTTDGIVAVDAETRDVRWRATIDPFFNVPPTVTDDGLYATAESSVVALDHAGDERWRRTVEGRERFGEVAATGGVVYAPIGGRLLALDAASGELRWEHDPENGFLSAMPVVAEESVVRADFDGVEAVSTDGTRRWLADGPDEDLLRPVVGSDAVFALGLYGAVTAYELASGERLWRTDVGDGEWTQETGPVLLDGSVVVPQSDGDEVSVRALDAASGEERWSVSASDARIRGPVAASGHLVATTQDRHVNADSDGTDASPPAGTIRAYEL